jgi:hypothetical protein
MIDNAMTTLSLSLQAERLRRTPWTDVIRNAWLVLLGGMALKAMLPAGLGHALRPLLLVAPLLVLIAKDLSHLPDALQRSRGILHTRSWRKLPAAWLPPELVGLLQLGAAQRRGCINWLLRRPQPALPAGETFSYLTFGAYRTGVAIVLFSSLVELPLHAVFLPLFVHDPAALRMVHAAMLAGSLSTLAWVLGDRWHVGAGGHVLTEAGLQLRVGARAHGSIPVDAIAACERIDEPVHTWLRRRGIARRDAVTVSPLDKPNTVLILTSDSRVRLTHLGIERTGLRCVFLYLDRPQDLQKRLSVLQI